MGQIAQAVEHLRAARVIQIDRQTVVDGADNSASTDVIELTNGLITGYAASLTGGPNYVFVNNKLFAPNPNSSSDNKPWVLVDYAFAVTDPTAASSARWTAFGGRWWLESLLSTIQTANKVGTESIVGGYGTHYTATVSNADAIATYGDSGRNPFEADKNNGFKKYAIDLWVDGDNRPVKVVLTLASTEDGKHSTTKVDIGIKIDNSQPQLSEPTEDVRVLSPENNQLYDPDQVLNSTGTAQLLAAVTEAQAAQLSVHIYIRDDIGTENLTDIVSDIGGGADLSGDDVILAVATSTRSYAYYVPSNSKKVTAPEVDLAFKSAAGFLRNDDWADGLASVVSDIANG